MKGFFEIFALSMAFSALIAYAVFCMNTFVEVERELVASAIEIKCRMLVLNQIFENLSATQMNFLEKINNLRCNFTK